MTSLIMDVLADQWMLLIGGNVYWLDQTAKLALGYRFKNKSMRPCALD
jgi:hypothetical protein